MNIGHFWVMTISTSAACRRSPNRSHYFFLPTHPLHSYYQTVEVNETKMSSPTMDNRIRMIHSLGCSLQVLLSPGWPKKVWVDWSCAGQKSVTIHVTAGSATTYEFDREEPSADTRSATVNTQAGHNWRREQTQHKDISLRQILALEAPQTGYLGGWPKQTIPRLRRCTSSCVVPS